MSLLNFLLPTQIITALLALIFYNKYRSKFMFWLCVLLFVIVGVESLGLIFLKNKISSKQLYNIYTFFEFNIISLMYFYVVDEERSKKFFKILTYIFNAVYFFSFFYVDLQYYTVTLSSVLISVFLIIYFGELLNSNKILNYKKQLSFWVAVGFFIFYLGSIPFSIAVRFMPTRDLFFIQITLIFVMNFNIIYGLIWSKKET